MQIAHQSMTKKKREKQKRWTPLYNYSEDFEGFVF